MKKNGKAVTKKCLLKITDSGKHLGKFCKQYCDNF